MLRRRNGGIRVKESESFFQRRADGRGQAANVGSQSLAHSYTERGASLFYTPRFTAQGADTVTPEGRRSRMLICRGADEASP